jgi:hypothetical protein
MCRPILVICLILTTFFTGCVSDRSVLAQKVDELNTKVAVDTSSCLDEWCQAHPGAGFTLVVAGIVVVAAAAAVTYVLICYRTHQPLGL